MQEIIIFGSMKMADVVANDQRTLVLMPRFGISFGFGDKTVKQICQENDIQTDFFLMMANSFLHPHYFPQKKLKTVDVKLLLYYLASTHEYYMTEKIPHLRFLVSEFVKNHDNPAGHQLENFFNDYIHEVVEHIEYEEKVVFPYIEQLLSSGKKVLSDDGLHVYTIRQFEERHNNIEEKLSDLKSLLIKYFPPDDFQYLRIRILTELFDLEQDLINHARLEDKILIPVVEKIEKQLISQ
jgi:regulator of cell morphogenesis and NO signaling